MQTETTMSSFTMACPKEATATSFIFVANDGPYKVRRVGESIVPPEDHDLFELTGPGVCGREETIKFFDNEEEAERAMVFANVGWCAAKGTLRLETNDTVHP